MSNVLKAKTKIQADAINALLNQSLANAIDLKMQAKQAHWNVKGENFIALHELFDKAAGEIEGYYDMLAERIVQLGGTALGTIQIVAKKSSLTAYPTDIISGQKHVKSLAEAIHALAADTRQAIDISAEHGDAVTADLYTEITRGLDKLHWFVSSHIA